MCTECWILFTFIVIEIKPYNTFRQIKWFITQETSIKPHYNQLKWKREITRDEDMTNILCKLRIRFTLS